MFLKKYLKWISTFLVLIGILLTNLNIYPINIYFHAWKYIFIGYIFKFVNNIPIRTKNVLIHLRYFFKNI